MQSIPEIFCCCFECSVRVICDHGSGKSKGYGFVVFDSEEAAATALASMDNQVCTENCTLNLLQYFMMT